MHAKGGHPVFEGGIDFRGIKASCVSAYKKVAHTEIENYFRRSTGISTGQDGDGGCLAKATRFRHHALLPVMSESFSLCETLISFFESGFGAFHFDFRP